MAGRSDRDLLLDAIMQERDAALDEARFERERAEQALKRNQTLRGDLTQLREQLRELLGRDGEAPPPAKEPDEDLAERLKLAMDTNWRLERGRVKLERQLEEARLSLNEEQERVKRLQRKLRALEGALRIAQRRDGP
ncbi:MAG: hypothetical protein H6739_02650 [Alphaproteobacteria bacterium]|nr:hypothetical protein [Alphaproteobacteria bacterium]